MRTAKKHFFPGAPSDIRGTPQHAELALDPSVIALYNKWQELKLSGADKALVDAARKDKNVHLERLRRRACKEQRAEYIKRHKSCLAKPTARLLTPKQKEEEERRNRDYERGVEKEANLELTIVPVETVRTMLVKHLYKPKDQSTEERLTLLGLLRLPQNGRMLECTLPESQKKSEHETRTCHTKIC